VGLGGMYTQTEFGLFVMKIQMPAAAWLEKLKHRPNISRRGNGNHLVFLLHISMGECSPCASQEIVCLFWGVCSFPIFSLSMCIKTQSLQNVN